MRAVTVYRMDYGRRTKSPIGVVRLARRHVPLDTADSAGRRFHHDGAIMIVNGLLGILMGGAMVALATNSFQADAASVMGPGSTAGMLILLGLGLVGLGIRGWKKIFQGTPIDGRYLALGMREVNLRGESLFQRTRGKEDNHE